MFRPGSHNPRTVYWSALSGPDRFVAVAMSDEAAVGIAGMLNAAVGDAVPDFVATLPMVPKLAKEPRSSRPVTVHFSGHPVGNHYWLDTKSQSGVPTYHWDGTEWEEAP